jgi:asparagine synthase (glutamine-hydrolysing)
VSGIAVVVRRSGEPVPGPVVEAVRASLGHRAPDGVDVVSRGGVTVLFGRLHATPEAVTERQPHVCADGTLLVADARLDDRAGLAARVGWDRPLAGTSDVELLARALERFGPDAPVHLLGDVAAVAVHPDGTLTCFRDHLGIKPLHHWVGAEWIVVASELRQIAAHPEAPREPDAAALGEHLSGWPESTTRTVVRGVGRVPAAHVTRIEGGRIRSRRYWAPPFDDPLLLDREEDYDELFRELFTEAVRCRLRAPGPVGAELSGGLDSSSVASLSRRLVTDGAVPAADVLAFSCLFPWSGRADEGPHIADVVGHAGLEWAPVVDDGEGPAWAAADAAFWSDVPLPPDGPAHVRLCRAARERGAAVVLTGHGGDHWFDPGGHVLPDLVRRGRPLAAWREASAQAGPAPRAVVEALARAAVTAHRPPWLHRPWSPGRAPQVTGEARAAARLDVRRIPGRLPRRFRGHRAQKHFEQVAGGYDAMTLGVLDRTAAAAGVEFRHPYFDLRLVEFGCRVPLDVHHSPELDRRLQRRALGGLLPPGVAARRSKARFSEVWLRAVDRNLPEDVWADALAVRRGWVDLDRLRTGMRRTREVVAGPWGAGELFALWGFVQVESVLRALEP